MGATGQLQDVYIHELTLAVGGHAFKSTLPHATANHYGLAGDLGTSPVSITEIP